MRKSFWGSEGMGGGGGGGGGGGMLRTVGRTVRAGFGGVQDPLSSSTTTTTTTTTATTKPPNKSTSSKLLSLSSFSSSSSSSSSSSFNLPISAATSVPTWPSSFPSYCDEFEWECVDGSEDERANGYYNDFVFGSVPSQDEAEKAVSALQQIFDPASYPQFIKDRFASSSDKDVADQITSPNGLMQRVSSFGSELDWIEPSLQLCNPRMLQPHGSDRVYDAFHLLQTEPFVQRMVISLSSDKAVWDAVLNNEVVRELRESFHAAENSSPQSSDESTDGSDAATSILRWLFDNTKAKVTELIEKIMKVVNELFQPPDVEKATGVVTDPFEEKLRSSFLLCVMVLLVVVVNRAHRA